MLLCCDVNEVSLIDLVYSKCPEAAVPITVNIHEAKTHLSRLVEQAAQGHEVVIAKAGKPLVRVVPVEPPPALRELGFLAGEGCIDLDVKDAFSAEIQEMFGR